MVFPLNSLNCIPLKISKQIEMIVIAESGATKTDWCLVGGDGVQKSVKTPGMNIAVMPAKAIGEIISQAAGDFSCDADLALVREVHYYAAGLFVPEGEKLPRNGEGLDAALRTAFPNAEIEYASDLLDAARAVCGHSAGIAAILGTGSNSCLYDGEKIVRNVRSGGFILGDEGGGACLGKLFMADFLKGLVPEEISDEFASSFKVDYMTVVGEVYRGEAPSKYLGSFAPWILSRYDRSEYIRNLVDGNFRSFLKRALSQYDLKTYPVGVVGGFGYACQEILQKIGSEFEVTFSCILPSPIEGLIEYHLGQK